jgi:deoxyribodipyrimidine photo-lyase
MRYFPAEDKLPVSIWWIRRDLRLEDNFALAQASRAGAVIPVFILDDHLLEKNAPRRQNFLFQGLSQLDRELKKFGAGLVLRRGDPLEELTRLIGETGAEIICAEEDFSPYARQRDNKIGRVLPLRLTAGLNLHHPKIVTKADGSPYSIFTPYKNKWMSLPISIKFIPVRDIRWHAAASLFSVPLPPSSSDAVFPAGEGEAKARLDTFIREKINGYEFNRDRMGLDGTSLLSPYLRFGMIAPGTVISRAFEAIHHASDPDESAAAKSWLNELIWREFYNSILFYYPYVTSKAFRSNMQDIAWNPPGKEFNAWQNGATGYPIVDAGMRQLKSTGWMHNRARMVTASFLVKDLLINWQLGEKWFMENLIDGDPAANNGGWQWVAGTGTDAAPYFRVFNPVTQSKRFDPKGEYIRHWVPELAEVPNSYIHSPWSMPDDIQLSTGCKIGKHYPLPIVNHGLARIRVLERYRNTNRNTTHL